MAAQSVEEIFCDLLMEFCFTFLGEDATIIHVILEPWAILIIEGLEDVVHEFLHDCWIVGRPKRHDGWRIEPLCCFEC